MRVLSGATLAVLTAIAVQCSAPDAPDGGAPPRADEFRSARVEQIVEEASRVVRTRGFAGEGEEWRGFLVEQATDVRSLGMRTGSCYVVVGAGSSALRELELRIFDGDGAEVAREAEPGSVAALHFCPAQNGTYFLAARAPAGSGLFAIRGFRGPTGLAFRVEDVLRAVGSVAAPDRVPE
jgi:hypothetical protein